MTRYFVAYIAGDVRTSLVDDLLAETMKSFPMQDPSSMAVLPSSVPGFSIIYVSYAWADCKEAAEIMTREGGSKGLHSRILTYWPHDVSGWARLDFGNELGCIHVSKAFMDSMTAPVIAGREVSA